LIFAEKSRKYFLRAGANDQSPPFKPVTGSYASRISVTKKGYKNIVDICLVQYVEFHEQINTITSVKVVQDNERDPDYRYEVELFRFLVRQEKRWSAFS
jgi:hypothetical protein